MRDLRRFSPGRRFAPLAVAAGLAGTLLLALSMTNTLSAFTAGINNTIDTAGSGSVTMLETGADGTTICTSTSTTTNPVTCATINKYGGNLAMYPGQVLSSTITVANTGSAPANAFSLAPSACTQSGSPGTATDMCAKFAIRITAAAVGGGVYTGPATVFTGSATALAAATLPALGPVPAGTAVAFTFQITVASSIDNTYQGLAISQPLLWTFSS